ncbi:MAG: flap endonuclease [Clostridiales bacterium]|nr:flap endonuclease [Clostridiales bacterium]
MDKLLLVDGSNLLFQMFYGMPARIMDSNGKPVHGVMGFVGALLKIIRMVAPTHVAVLFDGECANERSALLDEYKANRPDYSQVEEGDNPFSQLDGIYMALDYLGIKHAETTCCETDDWIAAYALTRGAGQQENKEEIEIVISSFDSDFFQLINDKVSVLRYRGKNSYICTPDFVRNRFGIEPQQYADFKAMVGDVADNIKGAPKVGPKTAASLLRQYGSLDGILANANSISKPSVRASIVDNAERLRVNYRLIKLTDGSVLPFTMHQLRYSLPDGVTTRNVLQEIGLF